MNKSSHDYLSPQREQPPLVAAHSKSAIVLRQEHAEMAALLERLIVWPDMERADHCCEDCDNLNLSMLQSDARALLAKINGDAS